MRNLLALIGLIVVGGAGLGWYLGWYKVDVQDGTDGRQRITIDLNTKKASGDARKFGETVAELVDEKVKKTGSDKTEAAPNSPPAVTPPTGGVTIHVPPIQIGGAKTP